MNVCCSEVCQDLLDLLDLLFVHKKSRHARLVLGGTIGNTSLSLLCSELIALGGVSSTFWLFTLDIVVELDSAVLPSHGRHHKVLRDWHAHGVVDGLVHEVGVEHHHLLLS